MCTRFDCNPQIIFEELKTKSFLAKLLLKHTRTGNLVNATPPTILPSIFLNLEGSFVKF